MAYLHPLRAVGSDPIRSIPQITKGHELLICCRQAQSSQDFSKSLALITPLNHLYCILLYYRASKILAKVFSMLVIVLRHDYHNGSHESLPARFNSQCHQYTSKVGCKTLSCITYHHRHNTELLKLTTDVPPTYLPAASHFTNNLEWDSSTSLGAHQSLAFQLADLCSGQPRTPLVQSPRTLHLGQSLGRPVHQHESSKNGESGISHTSQKKQGAFVLSASMTPFFVSLA